MYVGIDGSPGGWVVVQYANGALTADLYEDIEAVWAVYGETTAQLLIDIPIGLRERDGTPRPCDVAARERLSPTRHASVFPVPIRPAVHETTYEAGKAIQEQYTDRSIGAQTWQITDRIAEVDTFLQETPAARGRLRESHPEVCFWALNGETPTQYSKTGQPAPALWERIGILETVDPAIIDHLKAAASGLDGAVGNDDLIDAACLALTASPLTGDIQTLPETPSETSGDPTGLPMEIVYPEPNRSTEN